MIIDVIKTFFLLAVIMTVVAFITYVERKTLALLQLRKGPSVAGPFGLFQPIADCIKLLCKQILWPKGVSKIAFAIPPIISVTCALLITLFIPFPYFGSVIDTQCSVLYVLCLSLFSSFGECLPGLLVNSKYAQYGSYRAIIQVLSYELCLTLCVINVCFISKSFDFSVIAEKQNLWNVIPLCHVFVIYLLASLASSNRTPFDTLEAEQELIAGYHTEYSGVLFCIFYITEYTNILLYSLLISLLFLGGWHMNSALGFIELFVKTSLTLLFIIVTRAVLPRYRFNDIIKLFWGIFIPVLVVSIIVEYVLV